VDRKGGLFSYNALHVDVRGNYNVPVRRARTGSSASLYVISIPCKWLIKLKITVWFCLWKTCS